MSNASARILPLVVLSVLALAVPRAHAQTAPPAPAGTARASGDDELAPDEVEIDAPPAMLHPEVMPRLVAQVYPNEMRRNGIEGSVTLSMIVEPGGYVRQGSVRVLGASDPRFVQAARWVALRVPFRAATLGDREVAAPTRLSVAFVLRDL
ncbi:energy transducer TonB [Longimicrobium sp.]|uniref:energy transducer TonB n=1 Tax=Longimicrobium sp. TaxID=2029185 RepID=UPI002BADEF1C|nr:energy transducer TonB [Longimicrobium sp.]HSU13348.1 energy transducer TonB [Longimicrobium sp.]